MHRSWLANKADVIRGYREKIDLTAVSINTMLVALSFYTLYLMYCESCKDEYYALATTLLDALKDAASGARGSVDVRVGVCVRGDPPPARLTRVSPRGPPPASRALVAARLRVRALRSPRAHHGRAQRRGGADDAGLQHERQHAVVARAARVARIHRAQARRVGSEQPRVGRVAGAVHEPLPADDEELDRHREVARVDPKRER